MVMLTFQVALMRVPKVITEYPSTDQTLFAGVYHGIFVGVWIIRVIWVLRRICT